MKNTTCIFGILLILFSCNNYPMEVEEALVLAGDNRSELEKVLHYYKEKDKIAYKSACFLIGNMKYHESETDSSIDSSYIRFFSRTDSMYKVIFGKMSFGEINSYESKEYDSLRFSLATIFSEIHSFKEHPKERLADLQTIRADFLIDNIESALCIWKEKGYIYEEDFDFFKEFILPYRTSKEYLLHNRSKIRDMYNYIISGPNGNSTSVMLERYKVYVDKCRWINKYIKPEKHLGIYDLFIPKFKMDCHNMTTWSNNILRACGIPTVYEFTPKWIDRDSKHFWCVSPDSTGIFQPYTAPDNNFREDWESDIQYAGKVYRKTYGAQKETPYFMAGKNEFIPEIFNTPLLNEQTFRYHQTITLRIPLDFQLENRLAYLCMFTSEHGLTPVGWGKINSTKHEAVFEQLPLNTLFFPVFYDDETKVTLAEPFMICSPETIEDIPQPLSINEKPRNVRDVSLVDKRLYLTNGKRKEVEDLQYITLTCDTTQKTQLHLLRKYPEKRRMRNMHEKLVGACLLGGDQESGKYDTIYTLNHVPVPYLQEITFENTKQYRYYRFCTTNGEGINIAHIEFLGDYSSRHRCTSPTPLPVFSRQDQNKTTDNSLFRINGTPLRTGSKPEYAFDDNFNTYVGSTGAGLDFGTPVKINRFRFIPRNANNMIVPGDSYLLLYYENGWKEHKVLYAEHNYLEFDDVPTGTLYWLRNLSEGKEELPFFYISGKQYFLHIDALPVDDTGFYKGIQQLIAMGKN